MGEPHRRTIPPRGSGTNGCSPPPPPHHHHQQVKAEERLSFLTASVSLFIISKQENNNNILQLSTTRADLGDVSMRRGCTEATLCRNTLSSLLKCASQSRITPVVAQDSVLCSHFAAMWAECACPFALASCDQCGSKHFDRLHLADLVYGFGRLSLVTERPGSAGVLLLTHPQQCFVILFFFY